MSSPGNYNVDKLRRLIIRRAMDEKRRFSLMVPVEYRRLTDLVDDPTPGVRLLSGDYHVFNREELMELFDELPWYLRGFVKLPWLFSYSRLGFKQVYRLEGPDRWAARALNYLMQGDIAGEIWEVDAWSFPRLLRRYKSLILVVLRIEGMGDESSGLGSSLV